jgi:PBP1b-binding outer membrane lipoprotein LpoB
MHTSFKILALTLFMSLLLFGCGQHQNPNSTSATSMDNSVSEASSPDAEHSTEDRVIIKTANLSMDVNHVEQSVKEFQHLVNGLNGHIFHINLKNEKRSTREVKASLDSTLLIHEIHPYAMLKVKIPASQGDSFVHAVLNMKGTVVDFQVDENDVTETISEKKELMLASASGNPSAVKSTDAYYADKDRKEEYIQRKSAFSKMAYQTKFLWFDVELSGLNYASQQMISSAQNQRTPFYVRAAEALRNGWYGFSIFLAGVLSIWPFILCGVLLFGILRSAWFKRLLKTSH